jgi:hypothetical protein
MLFSEVKNVQTFLYIKILAGLNGKFKVGDYIKQYGYQYDDNDEERWGSEKQRLACFRSRIDQTRNVDVFYEPIYKITNINDGYMEVCGVNPFPNSSELPFYNNENKDIMGCDLNEGIESYVGDHYRDGEVEKCIEHFLHNYIKLDEDYADSVIFESIYTPYNNSVELKEALQKVSDAEEFEKKELLRRRALKGHATRRIRAIRAATEAARAARAIARLKRLKATKKTKKVRR